MGYNRYGQLGNGQSYSSPIPRPYKSLTLASLRSQLVPPLAILKDDGSLWGMGNNGNGQLGNGNTSTNIPPFKSLTLASLRSQLVTTTRYSSRTMAHFGQWVQWTMGSSVTEIDPPLFPIQVIDSGVAQVAAGANHSLFLKDDGSLWAMGFNWAGQLGNGNTSHQYSPFKSLTLASLRSQLVGPLAIPQGRWLTLGHGYNYYGQLGNGNTSTNTPPQVIDSGVALSSQSTGGTGMAYPCMWRIISSAA